MEKEPLEKLWIWKEAQELSYIVHELSKEVKNEFPLKDQIDRSAQSVCDNIAEMYGAYYFEVKKQSLRIARKECYETINHVAKFKNRSLWGYDVCAKLDQRYKKLIFGINKYINYIDKTKDKLSASS